MARQALSAHQSTAGATKLRGSFCSLRPDLDKFLFTGVGDETDRMPLSVISALTRLGLDPWEEADRLPSLRNREAVEELARLIAELPGNSRPWGGRGGSPVALSLCSPNTTPARRRPRRSKFARVTADRRRRSRSSPNSWLRVSSSRPRHWSAPCFTACFRSVLEAHKRSERLSEAQVQEAQVSVRLKIEDSREGLVATISQRDDAGHVIGRPSVFLVASKEDAKHQAKTLARSLGLKVYGIVDKSGTSEEPRPWLVPGVSKSI